MAVCAAGMHEDGGSHSLAGNKDSFFPMYIGVLLAVTVAGLVTVYTAVTIVVSQWHTTWFCQQACAVTRPDMRCREGAAAMIQTCT